MAGINNTTRCPICSRYGSPKHPLSFCGRCVAEEKQPKCIVSRCDEDAVLFEKSISRYCKDHLHGEERDYRRKGPESKVNDAAQGWRQEPPGLFEIVRDDFPVTKR